MQFEHFDSLKQYVGFGDAEAAALRHFAPLAQPHFQPIVEDFYRVLRAHPTANAAITGGDAQVGRLKQTLVLWLSSLLNGPHDIDYLAQHSRIGKVHVRISLPQEFMFTAMNRIRNNLLQLAAQLPEAVNLTITAINQVIDLELAIMLDTYRDDFTERIRGAERLSTIGQLAASIGHELRNPLGVAQSSIYLLEQRLKALNLDDVVLHKHRKRVEEQLQHCEHTISSLLEMTRAQPPRRHPVRLSDALDAVWKGQPNTDGRRLLRRFDGDLTVYADPGQLEQLLGNLIRNALGFVAPEGTLCVTAEQTRGGTEIYVQDDGPGVAEEHRLRIFDVLFTTRAHGTGLGLALCKKIAEYHGGELELVAHPPAGPLTGGGPGACFRVWFPDAHSELGSDIS